MIGRVVTGALAGATSGVAAGSMTMTPFGVVTGGVVGTGLGTIGALQNEGIVPEFHRGGIANTRTAGVFGESGREALVPLDQYDMSISKKSGMNTGSQSNSGLTLNFDSITINGGGSMTAGDVRSIISAEMPKIVKQSYRGARGVF